MIVDRGLFFFSSLFYTAKVPVQWEVMTEEGIDERELLWLLRSKVRRMIIEAVGDSGRIGAVALRDKLGISTFNARRWRVETWTRTRRRTG